MKKFEVICTRIYNASLFVKAETEEEALELARQEIEEDRVNWDLGESTADYAEETDNPVEDDFIN